MVRGEKRKTQREEETHSVTHYSASEYNGL